MVDSLCNYEHYLIKEIIAQKETILAAAKQDFSDLNAVTKLISSAANVFFIGCGSSYNACLVGADMFLYIAKKYVNPVMGSEFSRCYSLLDKETVVVALSQSGETADVIADVQLAQQRRAKIVAITNVPESTLAKLADITLPLQVGPEICISSTKSYTAQLAVMLLLAYELEQRGEVAQKMLQRTVEQVSSDMDRGIASLRDLATHLKRSPSLFLLGKDSAYSSAKEGALKIKEVSYIHAESFQGSELKHGPIALVEKGTPIIVLSNDITRKSILASAQELKNRGAFIIGVDTKPNEFYDYHISYKKSPSILTDAFAFIVPLQILSYYLALERGCDPDKPRNLVKAVTMKW